MSHSAISLAHSQLWDFAGIDGLQFASAIVGSAAEKISPFQSLEATIHGQPCSLLRLCSGNFRLRTDSVKPLTSHKSSLQIWVKQCDWMSAIAVSDEFPIAQIAIAKPPYRLPGLAPNCAAPAQIDGLSVLIWRHSILGQPVFEIHTATQDLETIQTKIRT
jgi:hypothetical protein